MATDRLARVKPHTRYKVDGKRVPSVTTITGLLAKPALVKWSNRLGLQGIDSAKYLAKTASIGTLAHHMVEFHLQGEEPVLYSYSLEAIEAAGNSLVAYLDWERRHEVEVIWTEKALVSSEYRYGGTIDAYLWLDGKRALVDFKTSKALYPEHFVQVAAYEYLMMENGYKVNEVWILRIGRAEGGGFEDKRILDTSRHFELFLHLRQVYELQKAIRGG